MYSMANRLGIHRKALPILNVPRRVFSQTSSLLIGLCLYLFKPLHCQTQEQHFSCCRLCRIQYLLERYISCSALLNKKKKYRSKIKNITSGLGLNFSDDRFCSILVLFVLISNYSIYESQVSTFSFYYPIVCSFFLLGNVCIMENLLNRLPILTETTRLQTRPPNRVIGLFFIHTALSYVKRNRSYISHETLQLFFKSGSAARPWPWKA